jgi:hypothetical protein
MAEIKTFSSNLNEDSGFYSKTEGDEDLAFAPNFVQWPGGEMIQRADKDTYDYPVNGYYWFNSRAEAIRFFSLRSDPHVDSTLADVEDVQFGTSANSGIVGPIPPDNDPNDDDQGILEKPDPYIPDGDLPSNEGMAYEPDWPPAYAEDAHLADPYVYDPTLEMDVPHQ